MKDKPVAIAEAYYTALGQKDSTTMQQYLHPDVQCSSPVAQMKGRDAVLEAVKKLFTLFKTLTIRAKFGNEDQAMVVVDLDFLPPAGILPSAVLLNIKEGLIEKIEIFFDASVPSKK